MFLASFLLPCSYDGILAEYQPNQAEFWMVECAKIAWSILEAFFMYQIITITAFSNIVSTWHVVVAVNKLMVAEIT